MDTRPILLVEDNPDDVELTLHALKANKITNDVVVAKDGAQAIDIIFGDSGDGSAAHRLRPALILLDLKLPGLSGFDVLGRIRGDAQTKLIPVVILTSSREHLDLMKAYQLGANSYVRKPVDFEQFLTAVQQLGAYWLALNEPVT